jgi:hypothetical protein
MDASRYFLGVASTPPLQGGEYATLSNSPRKEGNAPLSNTQTYLEPSERSFAAVEQTQGELIGFLNL